MTTPTQYAVNIYHHDKPTTIAELIGELHADFATANQAALAEARRRFDNLFDLSERGLYEYYEETVLVEPATIAQQLVAEFSGQSNAVLADAIHERYEGQYESNEESSPFSPMILTFADRSTLSIVGWDIEPDEDAERKETDDTPILTAGKVDDETDE